MTSDNEKLVERAKAAIHDVFGDVSVSPDVTRDNLNALRDEIDILLGAL